MPQTVVKKVDAENASMPKRVKEINVSFVDVADMLDIILAKNDVYETLNATKNTIISRIDTLSNKVDELEKMPNEIKKTVALMNKEQAEILKKMIDGNTIKLSERQGIIESSCKDAESRIRRLTLDLEHTDIKKTIRTFSNEMSSLKRKVVWLYLIVIICFVLSVIQLIISMI